MLILFSLYLVAYRFAASRFADRNGNITFRATICFVSSSSMFVFWFAFESFAFGSLLRQL